MSQILRADAKQPMLRQTRSVSGTSEAVILDKSIVFSINILPESISRHVRPVQVIGDSIKVKEYLLNENEPHAFRYNDTDYFITKTDGRIKMYELQD